MTWIPGQLQKVKDDVAAGTERQETVRRLLLWFGQQRRGRHVVAEIKQALRKLDLVTEPDFNATWIDGSVSFLLRSSAKGTTPPVVTKTTAVEVDATSGGGEESAKPIGSDADVEQQVASHDGGSVVRTLEGQDPSYSIRKLEAANRPPTSVAPNASVKEAITIMLAKDYSQLPVMNGERTVKGLFSWKSLGSRLALGRACDTVADAMDAVQSVSADVSIFQVAEIVARDEVVLVQASATDNKIVGIITTADVAEQFGRLGEPFLLIGEIENRIRVLIDGKFTLDELKAAKAPGDDKRDIQSVADLTFGEYIRILQNPENWEKCKLQIDRGVFVEHLDKVRDVRNDVMHFDPDGVDSETLEILRAFAGFLGRLASLSEE